MVSVRGATSYEVQVSTSRGFGTNLIDATTANRHLTPLTALTAGNVYWRVRASSATGTGGWGHGQFAVSA